MTYSAIVQYYRYLDSYLNGDIALNDLPTWVHVELNNSLFDNFQSIEDTIDSSTTDQELLNYQQHFIEQEVETLEEHFL